MKILETFEVGGYTVRITQHQPEGSYANPVPCPLVHWHAFIGDDEYGVSMEYGRPGIDDPATHLSMDDAVKHIRTNAIESIRKVLES